MSEKRTKADKAQREADLLDKKSSRRPPQNQGRKPREDFNQAAVRIVEEAAEKRQALAQQAGQASRATFCIAELTRPGVFCFAVN